MMSVSLVKTDSPLPSYYTQWQVVPVPDWEWKSTVTPHWIDDKYGQKVPFIIFDWWRRSSEVYSPRTNSVLSLPCLFSSARLDLFKKLGTIWKDRNNSTSLNKKIREINSYRIHKILGSENSRVFMWVYPTLLSDVILSTSVFFLFDCHLW
jgi:hypothetical protein